jgi:hypothetical protein
VSDTQTGQKLIEADFATNDEPTLISPVISGEQLTVTFTVDVFTSGTGDLKLSTFMMKPSGSYWELVPGDYDLGASYSPNQASTEFNWEKGTFTMICYGSAPKVTKSTDVKLVQLSAAGSSDVLDLIQVTVLTAGADEYQSLYNQKEDKLQNLIDSGVASGYTNFYENMLNQSQRLVSKGYVDEAIALLNAIPSSGEPMGSSLEMIILPAIGIAGAAAVVFAFMFLRARGKNSYAQMVIEDQIRDLEGLTLRAARVDRTISSNLESVKDRLKSLVGM